MARKTSALPWAPSGPVPISWLAASRLSAPQPPKPGRVKEVPSTVTVPPGCHPALARSAASMPVPDPLPLDAPQLFGVVEEIRELPSPASAAAKFAPRLAPLV